MGMSVYRRGERRLVFPLPASPHFVAPAQQGMLLGLSSCTSQSLTGSTIKQRGGKSSKTLQEFIIAPVPAISN